MGIEIQRREDWFANRFKIDDLTVLTDRKKRNINMNKYISISSKNSNILEEKINMLINGELDLKDKVVVVEIEDGFYLTKQQCEALESVQNKIKSVGADFKIKDGKYWDINEISVVSSQLDEVVNKIKSAKVEENGIERPLNDLEKFIWAYSFVANRKYQENQTDKDSSRFISSIIRDGDCVCVGFATILKELCDKLGIECYKNSCNVYDENKKEEFGHANNVVVINDVAYYCDACWDCVSERRPRRTFSNCLISFEDRKNSQKTKIYNPNAPFCDIKEDLNDLTKKLKEIESILDMTEDEYKTFMNYQNRISVYLSFIPKFEQSAIDFFTKRNYKEEAIYYYKNAINLIRQKELKHPLEIADFEKALTNIYKSMGNSEEKAKLKTQMDIEASIKESGLAYYNNAKNCFAKEYFNNLEV